MAILNQETVRILLLVAGIAAILYFMNNFYNRPPVKNDGEMEAEAELVNRNGQTLKKGQSPKVPSSDQAKVMANAHADAVRAAGYGPNKPQGDYSCFPSEQLMSDDLLPLNDLDNWADNHPHGAGILEEKNFLSAGHHIGINTVGQSLRNANMQLRSDPPNPQRRVSPWLQSSIGAETLRRPLEIGSNC